MEITIKSTTKIVELNGVPARVWQGQTESGVPVHCFITRISVDKGADQDEFEKELQSHEAPKAELDVYPLRMII